MRHLETLLSMGQEAIVCVEGSRTGLSVLLSILMGGFTEGFRPVSVCQLLNAKRVFLLLSNEVAGLLHVCPAP